jgi:hypothetical protein
MRIFYLYLKGAEDKEIELTVESKDDAIDVFEHYIKCGWGVLIKAIDHYPAGTTPPLPELPPEQKTLI